MYNLKFKKVMSYKRGDKIPVDASYLKTEERIVGYEDSGHWQIDDSPIYETFDIYEIFCEGDEK